MANTTGQAGFWGSNFNPQQAATQWGQGLQGALTNSSGATTAQDYGKQLGRALFSGPMMGAMPQAVQDRATAWFGAAPQAGTEQTAQTAPASVTPAATTPATTAATGATTSGPPAGEEAFNPAMQTWNDQIGAFLPNGSGKSATRPQTSTILSQLANRIR